MRETIHRLILSIVSVLALFGIGTVAYAENAHLTFTNVETNQPDLYITKTASSAVDGYSYPEDTEFTFVLKWDQDRDGLLEFAENEMYYKYNASGSQITENGSEVFRTSSTGRFTLKAGEYAKFEWAGQVEYEITELTQDGWVQIVPAGGAAATGKVDASGTIVAFENQYVPTTATTEYTQLEIRKDISWPSGYATPDLSDIQFTFYIEVDGKAYANQRYTLYDADLKNEIDSGLTDMSGYFSMSGDQAVVFSDIEVGVDYQITESSTDGWQAVGNTEYHGSTTAPLVYGYFANETSGLIVKKTLGTDTEDTGEEFTFTICDDSGTPASGLKYFLYDTDGNVSELQCTDSDGQFALKANESVIFIELTDGDCYTVSEIVPDQYRVSDDELALTISQGKFETLTFSNTYKSTYGFVVEKLNDFSETLNGAEFTLFDDLENPIKFTKNDDCYTADANGTITTISAGSATIDGLDEGTYILKETQWPDSYQGMTDSLTITISHTGKVTISEDNNCNLVKKSSDYVIEVKNYELTNIEVEKIWNDSHNQDGKRPSNISLQLYKNEVEYGDVVTMTGSEDTWTYKWSNLRKYDDEGNDIAYTVEETIEDNVLYEVSYDGLTITNSYTPEVINVSGSKEWDDAYNQDGARPTSIIIRLLADNVEIDSKEVTESDGWAWTFDNLPKYKDGVEIVYTVAEDTVEGYTSEAGEGAYDFKNSYEPAKTQISVRKAWEDNNNQDGKRPNNINVTLLKNGSNTGTTAALNDGNSWSYTFEDLDAFENGQSIEWSVAELDDDSIEPYESELTGNMTEGFVLTNTYTPETISISGEKVWDDDNDRYEKQPAEITVRLFNGETEVANKTVTAADNWKWDFSNLPKYESQGTEIKYEVKEDAVDGYETTITQNNDGTWTITNKIIPEPTLEKEVSENDGGAGNNQEITFNVTVTDIKDAVNLTIHDYMESGLDFENDSVEVSLYDNNEFVRMLTAVSDYNLSEDECSDSDGNILNDCTFEIHFEDSVFEGLGYDAYLVITYKAKTDTHADDYTDYEDALENHAYLTYGNDYSRSDEANTETDIYGFGVFKYADNDGDDSALEGAKFILSKDKKYATFTKEIGTDGLTYYILSGWTDDKEQAGTLESGEDGMIRIEGLDDGTYDLEEIEAPNDYDLLENSITVTIDTDGSVTFNGEGVSARIGSLHEFKVKNSLTHKNILTVQKTDSNGNSLSGAEFSLYKLSDEEEFEEYDTGIADENGKIVFTELYDGTYKLVETKAPTGYILEQDNDVVFELPCGLTAEEVETAGLSLDDGKYNSEDGKYYFDDYTVSIINRKAQALPVTGGAGTAMAVALGVIVMAIGAGIYVNRRHKEAQT